VLEEINPLGLLIHHTRVKNTVAIQIRRGTMNIKEKDKGDNNSTQQTELNYIDQQENLISSKKRELVYE